MGGHSRLLGISQIIYYLVEDHYGSKVCVSVESIIFVILSQGQRICRCEYCLLYCILTPPALTYAGSHTKKGLFLCVLLAFKAKLCDYKSTHFPPQRISFEYKLPILSPYECLYSTQRNSFIQSHKYTFRHHLPNPLPFR